MNDNKYKNNNNKENSNYIFNDEIIDIDDIKGEIEEEEIDMAEKKEDCNLENNKKDIGNNIKENNWFNRDGRIEQDEYAEMQMKKILYEHEKQIEIKQNINISELESIKFELYFVKVKVNSNEKPKQLFEKNRAMIRFSNLKPIPIQLKQNLEFLKFDYLTPIQREIMPYIQYGKDIVCISETGSGKTLSYLFLIIGKMLIEGVPKNTFKENEEEKNVRENKNENGNEKKEYDIFNIVYKDKIA